MSRPAFTPTEKKILALAGGDLPDSPTPFADIAARCGVTESVVLDLLARLKEEGVIRRFGATLRHQKAGYGHNAMVAWRVEAPHDPKAVGQAMSEHPAISHCYLRRTYPEWRYNLYTMIHGKNPGDCLGIAAELSAASGVTDYTTLESVRELKKTSMRYFLEDPMNAKSQDLFDRAKAVIPGGVNSPVRACKSVGRDPLFITRGQGSRMWTVDGQELIDYVMSWGPLLLGHCDPDVTRAVHAAVDLGSSFGAPCPGEVALAEALRQAMPNLEMVRMVSSGTEATMSALRLARACTGRDKVLKFHGCYHGHADSFLASAGSGVATLSIPGTPGVPADTVKDTLLADYNDLEAVTALFKAQGQAIACVFVEPVAGNMGLVLPKPGFLEGLRALCDRHGALLVFDEVITGFRLGLSGAQGRFAVVPDLTCLGKVIGGGFPVGAYGGKRTYMSRIAPSGDVYQAGTLSGNPVAMAAGLAMVAKLGTMDYPALEARTLDFATELKAILKGKGLPVTLNHVASMFTLFFTDTPVTDFPTAKTTDSALYATFFAGMRDAGVNLAPSSYECAFTSFAHTDADLEKTLEAARKVKF